MTDSTITGIHKGTGTPLSQEARFDRALEQQWATIARLTSGAVTEGEHLGKIDGVTLSAGSYDGSKQLELTLTGKDQTKLHVMATFGKDGERNVLVDLFNAEQEGIGFTISPSGDVQWHTTNGFMDEDIELGEVAANLTDHGFQLEEPLSARVKAIFDSVLSVAPGTESLNVLCAARSKAAPPPIQDDFQG